MPDGYAGPLYVEICPRSFSVVAKTGQMLNQIIFRQGETILSDTELAALHAVDPIVSGDAGDLRRSGLLGRPETSSRRLWSGYRAKPHTGVIDLGKINYYDPADYWEEIHTRDRPDHS